MYVCCWGMTFQLCVQSNWQGGSEEGWGVMRGAVVLWGLQTNRYHGEPLLSKPPRSQLLTCSVMGLLNSMLCMDMRISLILFFSLSFIFFLSFCTKVPTLLSVLLFSFLLLSVFLSLISLFCCFPFPLCIAAFPSFWPFFFSFLRS